MFVSVCMNVCISECIRECIFVWTNPNMLFGYLENLSLRLRFPTSPKVAKGAEDSLSAWLFSRRTATCKSDRKDAAHVMLGIFSSTILYINI